MSFITPSYTWLQEYIIADSDIENAMLAALPASEQAGFELWQRVVIRKAIQGTTSDPLKFPLILIRWITGSSLGTLDNFIASPGGMVAMGTSLPNGGVIEAVNIFRVTVANDRNNDLEIQAIAKALFGRLANVVTTAASGHKITCKWGGDFEGPGTEDGEDILQIGANYRVLIEPI